MCRLLSTPSVSWRKTVCTRRRPGTGTEAGGDGSGARSTAWGEKGAPPAGRRERPLWALARLGPGCVVRLEAITLRCPLPPCSAHPMCFPRLGAVFGGHGPPLQLTNAQRPASAAQPGPLTEKALVVATTAESWAPASCLGGSRGVYTATANPRPSSTTRAHHCGRRPRTASPQVSREGSKQPAVSAIAPGRPLTFCPRFGPDGILRALR